MRVVTGRQAFRRPPRRAVVTVGVFDGVHRAHQRLIQTAVRWARAIRGTSVAITFDPDPQVVLDPRHAPSLLMPMPARLRCLQTLGVDVVWVIPFTTSFARLAPETFVRTILAARLQARGVVVGETFAFGKDQRGNLDLLKRLGRQLGMRVMALRPVMQGGQPISSSRIRQLVQHGQLTQAQRLLGRPVELSGTVVRGKGLGRQLGFPTANIQVTNHVLPPRGVYQVQLQYGRRHCGGVMNLGVRPTFGPGPLTCEVHLVGFNGTLYGREVTIRLLRRLRDEHRFPTPHALARQIQQDLASTSVF